MNGPYPIFCRGHSGGRLLCEAFRQNGIWMGTCVGRTRDAQEFAQRNPAVQDLVRRAFAYPSMPEEEREETRRRMRALVDLSRRNCPDPSSMVAYGWKRAITTFMVEIFFDAFPAGRAVHLIRDGRDVMLSRLNGRMRKLVDDPLNRLVVFGDAGVSEYRGKPLSWKIVKEHRNEIEMLHWVTTVRFGLRGQAHEGRYLQVLYEDLCRRPVDTLGTIFEFIGVPYRDEARRWISQHAVRGRIGKWRAHEAAIRDAVEIGEPLLKELGYD